MSISTTTRKAGPFTGNGVTVAFPFTFKVFAVDDVKVVRGEIATAAELELTRGTHYSVTLNSNQDTNPGGTVNWIGTPLSSAFTLVIGSKVASTQPANFTNLGRFYPRVLNDALDRVTIVVQQLAEEVSRSVKVGFSGLVSPDELVNTITTAASTAASSAADAAAAASVAEGLVDAAQDAIDTANAASAGALQRSGGTMTGALVLPGDAASALHAVPKQQLDAVAAARMRYVDAGSQPTTSGVAVDYTPIPSWARRLTLILSGVSTSGSSPVVVRLGTAASIVASGYAGSAASALDGLAPAVALMGTGFDLAGDTSAGYVRSGIVVLERVGATNTWVARGNGGQSDSRRVWWMGGSVDIGADLTRVRLTTVGGVDTFDGGSVSLLIEGV